jgi:hypothetical protein
VSLGLPAGSGDLITIRTLLGFDMAIHSTDETRREMDTRRWARPALGVAVVPRPRGRPLYPFRAGSRHPCRDGRGPVETERKQT